MAMNVQSGHDKMRPADDKNISKRRFDVTVRLVMRSNSVKWLPGFFMSSLRPSYSNNLVTAEKIYSESREHKHRDSRINTRIDQTVVVNRVMFSVENRLGLVEVD